MSSMSLKFILCEPEEVLATRTRTHPKNKCKGSSLVLENDCIGGSSAELHDPSSVAERSKTKLDKRQHARQLQNLRQRRYRERKKSSVSALQSSSEQIQQENSALETAILEHFFKAQYGYSSQQEVQTDVQLL